MIIHKHFTIQNPHAYRRYLTIRCHLQNQVRQRQIYFSVSRDGMHWKNLGNGPVLVSDVGEKGVRDPFIVRSRIDRKFHIIATDLRIANGKGWDTAQYEGSTGLITWESEDLINWSKAQRVEMMNMNG